MGWTNGSGTHRTGGADGTSGESLESVSMGVRWVTHSLQTTPAALALNDCRIPCSPVAHRAPDEHKARKLTEGDVHKSSWRSCGHCQAHGHRAGRCDRMLCTCMRARATCTQRSARHKHHQSPASAACTAQYLCAQSRTRATSVRCCATLLHSLERRMVIVVTMVHGYWLSPDRHPTGLPVFISCLGH